MTDAALTAPTEAVARAKRFAALSGPFAPVDALAAAGAGDPLSTSLIASALAGVCDTDLEGGKRWLLRSGERRYLIETMTKDGTRGDAIAERRTQPLDTASADLLAALAGDPPCSDAAIAAALAAEAPDRAIVERIATALDRAGPGAPSAARLVEARATLAAIDRKARRERFDARGFFGRSYETLALLDWLDKPVTTPPARAAYVQGSPGIGKSALLEEVTSLAADRHAGMAIRLDFDRAGLDVNDLLGLTMEVARQVADRLGDGAAPLLAARLKAASLVRGEEGYTGASRGQFPQELAAAIGAAIADPSRQVLLVLDTVEVLRARGEQHPVRLFEWIDGLVAAGVQPMAIVAAGRGDAFGSSPDRVGLTIALDGLDGPATDALLDRLGVPAAARDAVIAIGAGNPLVLRLAATVVMRFGAENLPRETLDKDVAAAFLYRFLLSRIDDPELRALADPGLIARRISAAFLGQVLAPALGMPPLAPARAEDLFAALAGQHWLVERDTATGFVRHRTDMRAILLPLLYTSEPAQCARVDAAAAAWFGRRSDAASQADAAYHRLQMMRGGGPAPKISPLVAQRFDAATLAELPPQAQDVVAQAAGTRSSKLRSAGAKKSGQRAAPPPDDPAMTTEILNLIEREDWAEGQYVVAQMQDGDSVDPRGRVAEAIRAFHWRAGRWREARTLLAERDRIASGDDDLHGLPLPLALVRLEMRAEFAPARLRAMLKAPGVDALVLEAERSGGRLARQGALAFILAAVRGHHEPLWSSKDGDAVAAAIDLRASREKRAPATAHAFGVARDRLGARGLATTRDIGWDDPQLLAVLSPYPVHAANLALLRGDNRLLDDARGADARLCAAGALFPGGPDGLTPIPANPVAGVAGLGLFAEWAAARAYLARDTDLATIAAAAERWRRTVAGDWRYGPRPPEWPASSTIDRCLAARTARLGEAADPRAAALEQLGLWAPGGDAAALLARLQKRLAATLALARAEADPMARAALLLARGVPAAFVPPLAHLA
jgi:hypothetical protein